MSDTLKMSAEEALDIKNKLKDTFSHVCSKATSYNTDKKDAAELGKSAAQLAQALIKLDEHALKFRLPVK